jgi:hypothetical protein
MAEDWSLVRSPSRARRRLAQGHRQNIRTVDEPVTVIRHKPLLREMTEEIARIREDQP